MKNMDFQDFIKKHGFERTRNPRHTSYVNHKDWLIIVGATFTLKHPDGFMKKSDDLEKLSLAIHDADKKNQ